MVHTAGRASEIERTAEVYLARAAGNPSAALRLAIRDALADASTRSRRLGNPEWRAPKGRVRPARSRTRA